METVLEEIQIKNSTDDLKTKIIRKEVQLASKEFRAKYPIVQHQNAIGLSIFLFCIAMIILSAYLYLTHKIGVVIVVFSVALWTCFLHAL